MKLASRGKRFAAGLIDMIVPMIAYMFLVSIYGIEAFLPGGGSGYGYNYGYGFDYGYNYDLPVNGTSVTAVLALLILMIAYIIAELVLYARAQSIGKAILGLQVVSSKNGKPFGFWMMMLRELVVKSASSGTILLGYIWILIDDKNRGWHDKILDSYVVDLKETAIMYRRAQMQAQPQRPMESPRPEAKPEEKDNVAPAPVVEEKPTVEPKVEIHEVKDPNLEATAKIKLPDVVEALDEPEKVEALEAPAKVEILDAPIQTETSIKAAGDEQTEISEKEDDTEIK